MEAHWANQRCTTSKTYRLPASLLQPGHSTRRLFIDWPQWPSSWAKVQLAADLRQLVARINEGRFFVACVGQFKRGKSTLLDALVGEPILPTGVVPVTAVPTVLRYGDERGARVLIDSRWQTIRPEDLPQYVSEELNPENSRQVAGVEVFLPSTAARQRNVPG